MYKKCSLYAVQSKKMLCTLLGISDNSWLKSAVVQENIHPFIDETAKPRLIEAPSIELKKIQRRIKNYLHNCEIPSYVFSGIKNKSYIQNARLHSGCKFIYKIDLSAFFPNTSREKVYLFFYNELKNSKDVASCLTNFCTVDLSIIKLSNDKISSFLSQKHIRHYNHLCTGSATSTLLSYLVNKKMFDEIYAICNKENIFMTVYVDDIIFSSTLPINKQFRKKIINIIMKNGYNVSKKKVKYYLNYSVKKITGVIIKSDGSLDVPNKLRFKIIRYFNDSKINRDKEKLQGCLIAARQIKNVYPNIMKYITNAT